MSEQIGPEVERQLEALRREVTFFRTLSQQWKEKAETYRRQAWANNNRAHHQHSRAEMWRTRALDNEERKTALREIQRLLERIST